MEEVERAGQKGYYQIDERARKRGKVKVKAKVNNVI
jgi:hypothetical protein